MGVGGGEVGERGRGWDTDIVGVGTEIAAYLPNWSARLTREFF